MRLFWLGHSGFRIEIADQVLLVDPWLAGNPLFDPARRGEAIAGATHILISHGHGDHASNAVAIANELGIPVVGIYDLVSFWEAEARHRGHRLQPGRHGEARRGRGDAGQRRPTPRPAPATRGRSTPARSRAS